ncbi:hypothetical protein Tco_0459180 [Tanacetum coccineum]
MFQYDEGVLFLAQTRHAPGDEEMAKREKHKFNRRIWYVRNLHCRSDLVEITDVSMWVLFIIAKKLLVLDKIQKTMLDLKVIRGDFRNNYRILVYPRWVLRAFAPHVLRGTSGFPCYHRCWLIMLSSARALLYAYYTARILSFESLVDTVISTIRQNACIPSEDPYEEAAQQLLEQAPRSPEYVPDPMEREDHVPVYITEPEHSEDLVPAEDEAPTLLLPPSFLSPQELEIEVLRREDLLTEQEVVMETVQALARPGGWRRVDTLEITLVAVLLDFGYDCSSMQVVVATTTTAAAATPMILLHEQLVADRVPRHLLTMTLFETTRMVMAMEATILALEPEELRALRRTKLSSQLAFHGMPALGELPQEAVTQEVAYAMVWKAWKTS